MAYATEDFDVADLLPGLSRIDKMLARLQAKAAGLGPTDTELAGDALPHLETLLPRLRRVLADAEELASALRDDDDEPQLKFRKPKVRKNATPPGFAAKLLQDAQLARCIGEYYRWANRKRDEIAALEAAAG